MTMFIVVLTLSVFSSLSVFPEQNNAYPDPYEVLKEYEYPVGLLPAEVTGYKLDRCTGRFSVFLKGPCHYTTETNAYPFKFDEIVTGVIRRDRITNIRGVRVKSIFGWFRIRNVFRFDDFFEIAAGAVSSEVPIEKLQASPRCGCASRCENAGPVSKTSASGSLVSLDEESSIAVKDEEKIAESDSIKRSSSTPEDVLQEKVEKPTCPSCRVSSQGIPDQDVNNFSKLSVQLGEIAQSLREINSNRLNITLLYHEVMSVRDFDELTLLRAFDYLVKNDNDGKGFLAKTPKHRAVAVEGFCEKDEVFRKKEDKDQTS
ncbi:hypothetical protein RHSIM_Rhsim05G0039800 [Rhododendron simsii]|uniref:Uncharacterized protein n=1 Tax=Rhododendron simsii TaxID=118357 RepID=A0A834H1U1_RHOSS|nr:hypothetical protein RHSIM_Rhsim05G0039800 [Rhododendron simsii]